MQIKVRDFNQNQTKGEFYKKLVYILIIFLVLAIAFLIGTIRELKAEAYAREHNCTWQATGTMYGNDKDFVCVKGVK